METDLRDVAPEWWKNTMDMTVHCSLEKHSSGEIFVVLQYGTKGESPCELVSPIVFAEYPLDGWESEDPDDGAPADIAALGLLALQQLLERNGIKPAER